jgi:hypothetical protein
LEDALLTNFPYPYTYYVEVDTCIELSRIAQVNCENTTAKSYQLHKITSDLDIPIGHTFRCPAPYNEANQDIVFHNTWGILKHKYIDMVRIAKSTAEALDTLHEDIFDYQREQITEYREGLDFLLRVMAIQFLVTGLTIGGIIAWIKLH